MAGLLGLGGFSGMGGIKPPPGLLGNFFNPEEMRRQQMKQALLGAGIGMLTNGKGSFGEVLGQGFAGGLQGANQAGQNYRNDVMLYSQMEQQQQDRARQIGMENTKMGWTLEDRAKADAQAAQAEKLKTNQTNAIMDWAHSKSPEFQAWAQNFPEEAAKVYATEMAPAAGTKPTDDISEYNFAKQQGYTGTLQDWIVSGKRAGAPQTIIDMKGENAYAVDRNKSFAKRADEIDAGEQAAFKTLNSLNRMEKLIQDPTFYSGFGAEQLQSIKSMAAALGGDPNQVSSMEQFNTLSKQTALDVMGGSLGTGFSNADRDFVVGQVPYIGNTPEGNKAIIAINRKMQERKIEIAQMAREYEIKTGRLDAGFMQQLSAWAEANPLFTGNEVPSQTQSGTGKTSTGVPWKVIP